MQDDNISEWVVIAGAAALTALISLAGILLYQMHTGSVVDRPMPVTASETMAKALYVRVR